MALNSEDEDNIFSNTYAYLNDNTMMKNVAYAISSDAEIAIGSDKEEIFTIKFKENNKGIDKSTEFFIKTMTSNYSDEVKKDINKLIGDN